MFYDQNLILFFFNIYKYVYIAKLAGHSIFLNIVSVYLGAKP